MGITFKKSTLALMIAVMGVSTVATAQDRGGRGNGRGNGGGDREERQERREERREQRQENREQRQEQHQEQPQHREARPEYPQREDRREQRDPRVEERRQHPGYPPVAREERREQRRPQHPDYPPVVREGRREERRDHRPPVGASQRHAEREQVRQHRNVRRYDIERRRGEIHHQRQSFRQKHRWNDHRDRNHIRSRTRWAGYYNHWLVNAYRPAPVYFNIRWYVVMPDMNYVQYSQVEDIASNLEHLTREVFETMSYVVQTSPNQEYARRLTRVLGQLADASENYTDAVYEGYDYQDSLYDLFHLDEMTRMSTATLSGYSQEYRVAQQMNALRYYVQELLWIYRSNM